MAEKLNDTDVDMIELNISCPNVKQGGVQFGTSCAGVGEHHAGGAQRIAKSR